MSEQTKYETRVTRLAVLPSGEKLFSETCTEVRITDEAGGEFVEVTQDKGSLENGMIQINSDEWPSLRDAIDQMIKECRS